MRHSDADEAGQEEQKARARNKMSISGRRISVMGVGEVESQSKVQNEIEKPKVRQLIIAIPSALNDSSCTRCHSSFCATPSQLQLQICFYYLIKHIF